MDNDFEKERISDLRFREGEQEANHKTERGVQGIDEEIRFGRGYSEQVDSLGRGGET